MLNNGAFFLRALGRLTEALEPMRAGLEMRIKQEVWKSAAIIASNLSELELTLGEVAGAVGDAERSVTYADRSGDAFLRMAFRTTHADALHQAGRWAEAEARFREAEQMQAESQPEYPLLYSLQGFQYCDLLLAAAERAAWQSSPHAPREDSGGTANATIRHDVDSPNDAHSAHRLPHAEREVYLFACHAVAQRATQTLKWAQQVRGASLLDIALNHLTLGRSALYAAILQESPLSNLKSEIEQAVSGLRRAGTLDMLPHALLTRAWLRFLTEARTGPESAQSDLEEAWEIAQRGPMPLFLADILLSRVRLFGSLKWEVGSGKWERRGEISVGIAGGGSGRGAAADRETRLRAAAGRTGRGGTRDPRTTRILTGPASVAAPANLRISASPRCSPAWDDVQDQRRIPHENRCFDEAIG